MNIADLIISEAQAQGVDPNIALKLAQRESGKNLNILAVSPKGAQGVMQLMPDTAKGLGVTNAFDPTQNVKGGIKYLKQMLDRYGGDYNKAVMAYNAGPGAVDKYGTKVPYAETQAYHQAIMGGDQTMTPPQQQQQQASPTLQDLVAAQNQPQPNLTVNPQSLLGPNPGQSKGMNTLLSVLGSIGLLGGIGGNIVGGIKGNGAVGNGAIAAGTSLLGELQKQREAQQAYSLKQSILGDPGNSDLAKTALVSGNSGELIKQMLTGSTSKKDITQKTIDAQKALDILNPQQATDRKVAELGQIDAAKESFKDQKAQADSQELAALMQKPPGSLSVEQQARKQALLTGAKMDPKTMSGTLKTMLIGDNSPGVLYKNAVGSLSQIQDLKDSLSQIPTDEWARFEGKGIEEFQKVHPDANIAGIQALQYMISRPLVRTALKEKGKIPQQEYDKFNSSVFNLLSKSPAERERLFDLISQGAEEDAQYNASALKQFSQLTGDSDYIKNHPEQFPQTLESLKEKQTKASVEPFPGFKNLSPEKQKRALELMNK